MSKNRRGRKKLAWWQQGQPCPPRCNFVGHHDVNDDPNDADNRHISPPEDWTHFRNSGKDIDLLLMRPRQLGSRTAGDDVRQFVPTTNVHLRQEFRDAEPHIRIDGTGGEEEFKLPLAEATELHRRLGKELDRAKQAAK